MEGFPATCTRCAATAAVPGSSPRAPPTTAKPKFAPDGHTIAFAPDRGGGSYGVYTIDVLEPAASAITRVVTAPTGATLYGPSFAPDGKLATSASPVRPPRWSSATGWSALRARTCSGSPASRLSRDGLLYTADGVVKRRTRGGAAATIPFAAAVPVMPRRSYRQRMRDLDATGAQRTLGIASPVAAPDAAQTPANEATKALLAANVDMVLRVHRGGGFVIAGTDAPLDNPAVSLHTNLRAKVRFGFTPYEALTTATRNPARWLGLSGKPGEIGPGAHADLSFVDGNPLADIKVAAAVRMVMVGGKLHTVPEPTRPPPPRR